MSDSGVRDAEGRHLGELMLRALAQASSVTEERTSSVLILIGIAIEGFVLAWKFLSSTNILLGDLEPLEFIGALASGVAILISGAAIRTQGESTKRDALKAVSSTTAAYLQGISHPGDPETTRTTAAGR
jgi:hypothetical protein